LGGYDNQNENRYRFENKEINEKANTLGGKTWRFLPILSLLGVVGSLIGGAAGVTK